MSDTKLPSAAPVLALVRDLMFASKIMAAGKAAGVEVRIVREPSQLAGSGRLLLVDLNQPGAIDAAAAWLKSHASDNREVVGFVSHVDTATIAQARAAGITRVMARSGFVEALPGLIGN